MPLTDAYALKGLAARGRAYGPVRLWGSASFILGTFAAGFAADAFARAPSDLADRRRCGLDGDRGADAGAAAPVRRRRPSRRRRAACCAIRTFLAVVAAASLIQASHAVYYGFSALAWRAQGLDGAAIAALWALGVIAEIVLFALQARLPPFFTPLRLLTIGALGGALRWTAMAFDPPAAALPALQILHAASFGATHLGALDLHRAACAARPGGDRARLFAIAGGAGDGGGDRAVGLALCGFRRARLRARWR